MATLRVRGEIEVEVAPGTDQAKALELLSGRSFVMTADGLTARGIRTITVKEVESPFDDEMLASACARWCPSGMLYTS